MLRLIASEVLDGIVLPRLWVLYQFKRGSWWRIAETRGRAAVDKIARQRAAEYESDDE